MDAVTILLVLPYYTWTQTFQTASLKNFTPIGIQKLIVASLETTESSSTFLISIILLINVVVIGIVVYIGFIRCVIACIRFIIYIFNLLIILLFYLVVIRVSINICGIGCFIKDFSRSIILDLLIIVLLYFIVIWISINAVRWGEINMYIINI